MDVQCDEQYLEMITHALGTGNDPSSIEFRHLLVLFFFLLTRGIVRYSEQTLFLQSDFRIMYTLHNFSLCKALDVVSHSCVF